MWKDVLRLQFDIGLALSELGLSLAMSRFVDRLCVQGDGARPVMTIPGFTAPEQSMAYLARFLNRNGFAAQGWGLGPNRGPIDTDFDTHVEQLARHLEPGVQALADRHGHGVALIGHSLGGVYARELALHLHPCIDRVITLGAPIFPTESLQHHNAVIRHMGELQTRRPLDEVFVDAGTAHWPARHPEIPCIAIYSPIDGAVSAPYAAIPHATIEASREGAIRENVRIIASHTGMSVNPLILLAVADRLSADADDWQIFDPQCYRDFFALPLRRGRAALRSSSKARSRQSAKKPGSGRISRQDVAHRKSLPL